MKTTVVVLICGAANSWKVAEPSDPPSAVRDRVVNLEIQGTPTDGYHLVMAPDGCFTADSWYESIEEAREAGRELFGVPPEQWR